MSHPVVSDQAGPDGERVIGIIDLGSNSLRLMLVRILPDGSHTVLNQVKNMVRLGEGAFETGHLREESMARTINVLRGMAEMCGVYGASEVIAIATAAVRDAANGPDFMRRVKEKTGIDFRVVSGREEARLIYLGVSSGLAHTESLRLFIDIGGGSTELVVGNSEEYRNLDSLKMGCVRLSNLFFDKDSGTISAKRYAALQNYIRNNALRSFQRIADFVIEEAVASSGTAQNLAEIAAALDAEDAARTGRAPQESRDVLSYGGLRRAVKELCGRTLKERRSVPGINPNRADVIVAGAAILQTIMEDQGFDSVRISNRNLQNGILVDYLSTRMPHADGSFHPVRKEIVLHLAAQPIVRDSYKDPVYTYETNVMGSVNILECVRLNPCVKSFLNVTTDKVYENREWEYGYREVDRLDGYDPYSNSKSCSELVTHSYKKSFFADGHCAISTCRAGNVIGGGDFANDRIVPDCVRAAMAKKPIIVRNPHSTRPYQHVLEPLAAYLMVAKAQYEDGKYAGYYNVGPDDKDCVTTGELVDMFCNAWGNGLSWENKSDGGPHEANFLKLDCSKLKTTFGWHPRYGVKEAIGLTVEWCQEYEKNGDVVAVMDRQIAEMFQ